MPEEYKDKVVVLLGASSSGTDISLEISKHAKTVYLSHNRDPLPCALPENVQQVKGIEKVDNTGMVYFMDGEKHQADGIIFCTGYTFSFPFLTESCGVIYSDFRVELYKHLFNTKFPTMAFVGITNKTCPFPLFHCQTHMITSVLIGQTVLPLQEEMEQDIKDDFEWRIKVLGFKPKWAHFMGGLQWRYNDELCEVSKSEKVKPCVENLYNFVSTRRKNNLMTYKKESYKLTGDNSWEINLQ